MILGYVALIAVGYITDFGGLYEILSLLWVVLLCQDSARRLVSRYQLDGDRGAQEGSGDE